MTMQIKKLATSPSRSGRHLQRYNKGFRQVVGCVPYRIRKNEKSSEVNGGLIEDLEVLLISSQKSNRMMFPKGGWELDEDIELAASRETMEEAGVIGLIGDKLGEWEFKSRSQEKYHEASMFSLLVTEELDVWPEKDVRQRVWMSVNEARELCSHVWMKAALEAFVCQVFDNSDSDNDNDNEQNRAGCKFEVCRPVVNLQLSIGSESSDEEVSDCYLVS